MARARLLKPGFFTNDVLAELPMAGRLLFAGIWTLADREGRLEDRPRKIKAEVLPYDDADVDALLTDLASHHFLVRYEHGGIRYIQIVNFGKHQSPHVKEPPSVIPAPDMSDASPVPAPDMPAASPSSRAHSPIPHSPFLKPIPEAVSPTESAAKPPANEHKQMAVVLSETEGYAPEARLTKNEWGRFGTAAKELLALGATADEVRLRAGRYKRAHPDWEYTANALVSHWGKLTAEQARASPNGNGHRPVTFAEQKDINTDAAIDEVRALIEGSNGNGSRAIPGRDEAGRRRLPG